MHAPCRHSGEAMPPGERPHIGVHPLVKYACTGHHQPLDGVWVRHARHG